MADDGRVVWQPDVARLVMRRTDSAVFAALRRRGSVRIDDEGALDIDPDAPGTCDGVVNLFGRGHGARPLGDAPVVVVSKLMLALFLVVWRGCRSGLLGRNEGRHCRSFICLVRRPSVALSDCAPLERYTRGKSSQIYEEETPGWINARWGNLECSKY